MFWSTITITPSSIFTLLCEPQSLLHPASAITWMALSLTVKPTNFLRSTGRTMFTRCDVRGRKSHFVVVSINICDLHVSFDRPVGKFLLLFALLLMCPYIHFVRPLTDWSIGVPSVYLCPLIGVSDSLLIYWSVNSYFCLFFNWCVPLSTSSVRW